MSGKNWSRAEVEAAVADYLAMYEAERRNEPFNKAEHNRRLRSLLDGRTKQAVELKHHNISAAMIDLGMPYLEGYVPYKNYQGLVFDCVASMLADRPELVSMVATEVVQPAVPLAGALAAEVDPPKAHDSVKVSPNRPKRQLRLGVDFLAQEAENRSLGFEGEEHMVRVEIDRLARARKERLASQVEHVSRTRGDGAGYDILSFDTSGKERFIEVKTTRYGKETPFFVTRNETAFSKASASQYRLCRLFSFRRNPQYFTFRGDLADNCVLDPILFKASRFL